MANHYRNPSVSAHQFSMIPRADIPRSSFRMQTSHKTTFNATTLVPVYVQEVLPGDSFNLRMTAFSRMATPIYPIMDNMHLESFFFFVPNRLVWDNWQKFMGEQENPGDSTDYRIPHIVSPAGGFARSSIYDYMGLPCAPNLGTNTIEVNALPLRAYNLIFNEWFRDQNLVPSRVVHKGDGPDPYTDYGNLGRGKRHDYFTSCLPWTQKGPAVGLPMTGNAPVYGIGVPTAGGGFNFNQTNVQVRESGQNTGTYGFAAQVSSQSPAQSMVVMGSTSGLGGFPEIYADLSEATAATINQLRQAFQIQKLLERDARGGTRYTEIIRSHFGVISPDARLQRPEYLGGGSSPVSITPVVQSTQTGVTGGTTPMGTLAGIGTNLARGHGFSRSFTEHGYILGLVNVRADLAYQQGVRKLWSRKTRYDFYFPVFAALGEQAVLNKEIYCDGSAADDEAFGYQERWAEYRYHPSMITGFFNSTNPTPLDSWHLAQEFGTRPTLNKQFIDDGTYQVLDRIFAAGNAAQGQQFLCDIFFDCKAARPMPMYSVPGLIDHF